MPTQLFGDVVALSDTLGITIYPKGGLLIGDALALGDSVLLNTVTPNLQIGDPIGLTDAVGTFLRISISLSDTLSFSDQPLRSADFSFSDSYTLSDAAANTLTSFIVALGVQAPGDSLQFFDSTQGGASDNPFVGDSYMLGDSVFALLGSSLASYIRRYANDVQN